jgi:hypothetical protein
MSGAATEKKEVSGKTARKYGNRLPEIAAEQISREGYS